MGGTLLCLGFGLCPAQLLTQLLWLSIVSPLSRDTLGACSLELQCELGTYQALLVLVTSGEVTYEPALAGAVSSEGFYLGSR